MRPSRSTASSPGRPRTIGNGDGDAPGLGEAGRPGTISGGPAWGDGLACAGGEATIWTRVATGCPLITASGDGDGDGGTTAGSFGAGVVGAADSPHAAVS